MRDKATTPAASYYLFETNQYCPKLTEDEARFFHYFVAKLLFHFFHHLVAKLLFLCNRGRPDIQKAIAFLGKRVKDPNGNYLKNLGCVIKYLDNTSE
jgi:hypothetical protein